MQWKAVVDRIEGDIAVLLAAEDEFVVHIPLQLLPNIKEGDHLQASWAVDPQATEQAKDRVTDLLQKLINRNNQD